VCSLRLTPLWARARAPGVRARRAARTWTKNESTMIEWQADMRQRDAALCVGAVPARKRLGVAERASAEHGHIPHRSAPSLPPAPHRPRVLTLLRRGVAPGDGGGARARARAARPLTRSAELPARR
jgi:hypothetical protein